MSFPLTVKKHEVVAASLPMQEHWLPMSNLDLLLPPLDFGIFLCYKSNQDNQFMSPDSMVSVMRKALAETLVSFYPLAGEIVQNSHGEPEILCNNRGVDFVHACVDVALVDLDLHRPDVSIQRLVPTKMHGVLAVQATELKCGGLAIGCTFDHRAADAHSANMFLAAWAELAQSKEITLLPTFRRSLLNPRRPPQPHSSLDKFYVPLSSVPPPTSEGNTHHQLSSRIYYVKSEEIDRIQSLANCNGSKRSRIESFSAYLWKSIADTSTAHHSMTVKLGIVIDGRSRLITGGKGESRPLESYFGNVLSVPYVQATLSDLQAAPLESVADAVHGFVAASATGEHFSALIDWVELRRPKPAVVKVYCKDENDDAAVVVSSGQRFPVSDIDFGWGEPVFGSYHFPWGGETGYVMPMPSARGNGAWIVYMHLMGRHLDLLEEYVPHVFIPFDHTFLTLDA